MDRWTGLAVAHRQDKQSEQTKFQTLDFKTRPCSPRPRISLQAGISKYYTKQTSELLFMLSDGKIKYDNVPVQTIKKTRENKSAEGGTNKP